MKMMVVGGKRSREYAEHIQNQFSIATQVIPGVSLEDVERVTVLGNVLERVLILEQAWTVDGLSTEDREVRRRIGEMTKQARDRQGNEQFVFMALSPESAMMCFEETYDICDRAVVVLYQQKATVVILHELLATDIASLRPILIFNPPITVTEEPYTVDIVVESDVAESNEQITIEKRAIKKTRGASIQRLAGDSPWYAAQQSNKVGGVPMNGQAMPNFAQDMFGGNQNVSMDKGFADDSPYVSAGTVDMSGQLQHLFKNAENPYAPQAVQPSAVIPVAPAIPASGDMKSFICSKAHRGYVLAFLGPGGSGSTFMALNCAARIYSAGFSTMFVDGDTTGHSAQYLTRLGVSGDVLAAEASARTLRAGFDMYGAGQFRSPDGRSWELPPAIMGRYDFIILDIPFHSMSQTVRTLSLVNRIIVTVESSNWGIGKAALALFNAPVDVSPIIREKAKLLYNRSDKLSSGLFGSQVSGEDSIKQKVNEVFGARASVFVALQAASIVGSYASAEEYWYSEKLFSDSVDGANLFDGVVRGVLS